MQLYRSILFGDPFKVPSSVALNHTSQHFFGLLAMEIAISKDFQPNISTVGLYFCDCSVFVGIFL